MIRVARPKKAAPPKKMESCLRDRGAKMERDGSGRGEDGEVEGESDMGSSGDFSRSGCSCRSSRWSCVKSWYSHTSLTQKDSDIPEYDMSTAEHLL